MRSTIYLSAICFTYLEGLGSIIIGALPTADFLSHGCGWLGTHTLAFYPFLRHRVIRKGQGADASSVIFQFGRWWHHFINTITPLALRTLTMPLPAIVLVVAHIVTAIRLSATFSLAIIFSLLFEDTKPKMLAIDFIAKQLKADSPPSSPSLAPPIMWTSTITKAPSWNTIEK